LRGSYSRLLSGDMHPKCLLVLSVHGIANEAMLYVHGFSYPAASFINYSITVNPEVTFFCFLYHCKQMKICVFLLSESKICIFLFFLKKTKYQGSPWEHENCTCSGKDKRNKVKRRKKILYLVTLHTLWDFFNMSNNTSPVLP
jgi:hypothetical protein